MSNDGEFNKFLGYDEDKIKSALEHIKTQLDSCNGKENAENLKTTFKEIVKGSIKGGIGNFTTETDSTCNLQ